MTVSQPHIYLTMPQYGRTPDKGAAEAFYSARGQHDGFMVSLGESAGGCTHNNLWCAALNQREKRGLTIFGMIHTDVEVLDPKWLEILFNILRAQNADFVSVVIPQKNLLGLTLTGLLTLDEQVRRDITLDNLPPTATPRAVRRLTMREIYQMPATFTVDDIVDQSREPKPVALVSGLALSLCRLDRPWCEDVQLGCAMKIYRADNGKFVSAFESEDWYFSEHVHRAGGKIVVTREVPAKHHGDMGFPNTEPWGQWDYDRGTNREVIQEEHGGMSMESQSSMSVRVETDQATGEVQACYLRISGRTSTETREFANGSAFADYAFDGALVGIEILGPCPPSVLNEICQAEPDRVQRFVREAVPAKMLN